MKRLPALLSPLTLAAYPVLFLFAHNQGQTYATDVVRPLTVAVLGTAVLLAVATLVYRDAAKAGVLVSAFVVLFFAYGHIVNLVSKTSVSVAVVTGAIEIAALVALAIVLFRSRTSPTTPATLISVVAAVLIVFPLSTIAFSLGGRPAASTTASNTASSAPAAGIAARRPDIYYIILDSYPSQRSLEEFYDFDNAPFVDGLKSRGFQVADDSKSNYGATLLSLGSSLNMTYLDDVTAPFRETSDRTVMMDAVRDSAVVRTLREQGYRFVSISSGFSGTDPMPTADTELRFPKGSLTEFEVLAISTTPLAELPAFRETTDPFLLRRFAVLHGFEALAGQGPSREPTFVLAHILSPHPPFVFDAAGGMRERKGRFNQTKYSKDEYLDGFRGQVTFVNDRLIPAIDAILGRYESSNRPIIIVQGDHGPRSLRRRNNTTEAFYRERFSILNAYHVPKDIPCEIYPTISPVNTFRKLFAALFGTPYEMLPDESYFSTSHKPYAFKPVSALVQSDSPAPGDDEADDHGDQ